MGIYKFDTSTNPITRYEWDDGAWEAEGLSRNEVLTDNGDGSFTLVKTYANVIKTVVYAPTLDSSDDPSWYAKASESYTLPDGSVIGEPADEDDDDGIEDDQDGDGSSDDDLNGTDGNDREHGGNGDDLIDGADGDDDLSGDQGDDHVDGGNGRDKVSGGVGFDVLSGGAGSDNLSGDADDDVLDGGVGSDNLNGGTGDDDLDGGDDGDKLDGGVGDDLLDGGSGNDIENGGVGDDDFLAGGDGGNDRLIGGSGLDEVDYSAALAAVSVDLMRGQARSVAADAGIGVDSLNTIEDARGSAFNDLLSGSNGNNRLDGGDGDDVLLGGAGFDVLLGGAGGDLFKFTSLRDSGLGARHDVIADFASGDHIDLSVIDARAGYTRNDSFSFLGGQAPTLANANGALWFQNGVLYASTDTDVAPEFEIALTGVTGLAAEDLVL